GGGEGPHPRADRGGGGGVPGAAGDQGAAAGDRRAVHHPRVLRGELGDGAGGDGVLQESGDVPGRAAGRVPAGEGGGEREVLEVGVRRAPAEARAGDQGRGEGAAVAAAATCSGTQGQGQAAWQGEQIEGRLEDGGAEGIE